MGEANRQQVREKEPAEREWRAGGGRQKSHEWGELQYYPAAGRPIPDWADSRSGVIQRVLEICNRK